MPLSQDIAGGLLVGAFAFTAHGVTLLFTHAGLRPQVRKSSKAIFFSLESLDP